MAPVHSVFNDLSNPFNSLAAFGVEEEEKEEKKPTVAIVPVRAAGGGVGSEENQAITYGSCISLATKAEGAKAFSYLHTDITQESKL